MNRNDWREHRNIEDSAPCLAGTPALTPTKSRKHRTQTNPHKKFLFTANDVNPSEMSQQTTQPSRSRSNSKNWIKHFKNRGKNSNFQQQQSDWRYKFPKKNVEPLQSSF